MADLGLVTDAQALLVELGRRFSVDLPDDLTATRSESSGG
jgi:hypothetical protein